MKLLTQAIYLSWEQKNPQNSENIEKHTPLNYTGSYKQNKVSFIFTSAGVMTGNAASLHHWKHDSTAPTVIVSAKPKVPNDFPAILSSSSQRKCLSVGVLRTRMLGTVLSGSRSSVTIKGVLRSEATLTLMTSKPVYQLG